MALKTISPVLVVLTSLLLSCAPMQHISKTEVSYQTVDTGQEQITSTAIDDIIAPYKDQINAEMNEVIGIVASELTKGKPESKLGNFVCDAMLAGALKEDPDVAFAMANYGGLRIPYITAGPLTKGQIFELSPFDNLLVIVEIPGDVLDSLMYHIASVGGWPVSSGLKMKIDNGVLVDYTVKGQQANASTIYKVALPDYIADGGDGLKELIPLERSQSGRLVRDIIMAYAMEMTQKGKEIDAQIEGRIINVK